MSDQEKTGDNTNPVGSDPVKINRPRLSAGDNDACNYTSPNVSPGSQHMFLVPSPLLTRRTRTFSASRRASEGPIHHGTCKHFSRSKGHGFILPDGGSEELIFMHVSDIDSEYVPLPGDGLSYRLAPIPPKNEKFQAVDVRITSMRIDEEKQHIRWDGTAGHI